MSARAELLGQSNADLSGQMVIAGAGAPQLLLKGRSRPIARRARDRHVHDAFQHPPDMRTGQPVVVVAALLHEPEQLAVGQLGEVAAGGLRRDTGRIGKLARGQCPAVKQRAQDVGARGVAHQRSHFGNFQNTLHAPNMRPNPRPRQSGLFGPRRSVPVGKRVAGNVLGHYVAHSNDELQRFLMTATTTKQVSQRAVPQRAGFDRKSLVLFTTCLGVFIAQLDTSVVNLALKHVNSDLGSNVSQLQWIVDAYNLSYASFLLTGGILGDVVGRRRIFIVGNILFAIGSLVCGFAPDNARLIAGRGLSGLGAALELPVSLAIVSETYPQGAERARAIGIWASCNGIAWLVGPATGGLIVDYVGWRGIFLVTVPFGALACLLAWKTIAAGRGGEQRSIDVPGQVLAVIALATFAFAF